MQTKECNIELFEQTLDNTPRKADMGKVATLNKVVWIDIDNSPHVPFFLPIIHELQGRGVQFLLTARDAYQVRDLLKHFNMPCQVIGKHYGKNKILKVLGNCARAAKLFPLAMAKRPDLAVSHGSRAQVIVSKSLGIPTLVMHDYEYSVKTGFLESDWILMPDVIPNGAMTKKVDRVLKYPGLKEDVYVPQFIPDRAILDRLHLNPSDLIVTLRPPATEAHYHQPESDVLFDETVRFLGEQPHVRVVVLPRGTRQNEQLRHSLGAIAGVRKICDSGKRSKRLEPNLVFGFGNQRRRHYEPRGRGTRCARLQYFPR